MAFESESTPCAVCRTKLFDGGPVVLCSRCGRHQHQRCWAERGERCVATERCKGKALPVAVVELEPRAPSAAEIAAEVEARVERIAAGLEERVLVQMANQVDVESLRSHVTRQVQKALERLDETRDGLKAAIGEAANRIAALESAVAEASQRPAQDDGPDVAAVVRAGVADAVGELRASLDARLDETRARVLSELHRNLLAIEACRWDTAAARDPIPWDDRAQSVVLPAAATEEG